MQVRILPEGVWVAEHEGVVDRSAAHRSCLIASDRGSKLVSYFAAKGGAPACRIRAIAQSALP
jgi:hypothetical protein